MDLTSIRMAVMRDNGKLTPVGFGLGGAYDDEVRGDDVCSVVGGRFLADPNCKTNDTCNRYQHIECK